MTSPAVPAPPAAPPALPDSLFTTPPLPGLDDGLAGLRDIHLPADVPFWPPAPGWVALAAVAALVLLVLAVREWLWRRTIAYQAMKEFEALARDARHGDAQALAAVSSGVLRRLAQARGEAAGVAVLTGEAWTSFLGSGKPGFSAEMASFLASAPYLPPGAAGTAVGRAEFVAAVRRWIRARA